MGTLAASKFKEALNRAKSVGLVEEACTIAGCDLVFRSLTTEEYVSAIKACEGLDQVSFMFAYQREHVCRSIIEVNGLDLRDATTILVDEQRPNGDVKQVKVERHQYLNDNLLSTWGKEVLHVAFQKVAELIEKADQLSREGVTFVEVEETPEDRYRNLLLEAKELEDSIPDTLLDKVLREFDLVRTTSSQEFAEATEELRELDLDAEGSEDEIVEPIDPEPEMEVAPEPAPVVVETPKVTRPLPPDPHATLANAIAARTQSAVPAPVAPRMSVQDELQMLQALEEPSAPPPSDIPILDQKAPKIDPSAVRVHTGPVPGINPKFKPSQPRR